MDSNNKKILLVYPGQKINPLQKRILLNLPLGILQLAAYLLERGYKPEIHDMRVDHETDFIKKLKNSIAVGFSCMTGHQIKYSLEYAKIIKKNYPNIPVIFGGIHPTLLPEQTLEDSLVDFVVIGEGEENLYQLLKKLKSDNNFKDILGIGYKSNGKVIVNGQRPLLDLDDLPMPAYHLIDMDKYPNIKTNFTYQSSRGCPYRCGFCYNLKFSQRHFRVKSAEKIIADMEYLIKNYGIEKFGFVDDEFFINKNRVERYCDLILEKNINIEWNASCRLDLIRHYTDKLLCKIRKSGCKSINFGAESGSDKILKYIDKDISVEDIIEGAKHAAKNQIKTFLSFMAGFPKESVEDILETKNIIDKLSHLDKLILINGVFPYNAYPGTTLFDEAVAKGLKMPNTLSGWGDWNFQYNPKFPWITKEHNNMIKVLFCIVRLRFYLRELNDRTDYSRMFSFGIFIIMSPWILLGNLRWKYNFYKLSWEWDIWMFFMRRIFGFI